MIPTDILKVIFFISILLCLGFIIASIWLALCIVKKRYGEPEPQEDYETVFNRWRQEAEEGKTSLTFQAWRDKYYKLAGERG